MKNRADIIFTSYRLSYSEFRTFQRLIKLVVCCGIFLSSENPEKNTNRKEQTHVIPVTFPALTPCGSVKRDESLLDIILSKLFAFDRFTLLFLVITLVGWCLNRYDTS